MKAPAQNHSFPFFDRKRNAHCVAEKRSLARINQKLWSSLFSCFKITKHQFLANVRQHKFFCVAVKFKNDKYCEIESSVASFACIRVIDSV